ncbi:MAG TPA: methylmalonyl Co-A mutase-associated GTPase MeaB [Polyangiaceae bacterium]|jgi:LAO/AO transport system kinase
MNGATDALVTGVCSGDRRALAKAITLVESERAEDVALRSALLASLPNEPRSTWRLGVTGAPGAGKSSLIERLGLLAIERGQRVAVLAVDPSSPASGGSVLGDKTRMVRLSASEQAFIRPSPARGARGGAALRTREAIALCEAAGYDLVIVETVGVGQAEYAVAEMVDSVLLVLLPGAGDGIQALKRGLLELSQLAAVNKADGERLPLAERDARELADAFSLGEPPSSPARVTASNVWQRRALAVSALSGYQLAELWQLLRDHRQLIEQSGELELRRAAQRRAWLDAAVEERLRAIFLADSAVVAAYPALAAEVSSGALSPEQAAERLLSVFTDRPASER